MAGHGWNRLVSIIDENAGTVGVVQVGPQDGIADVSDNGPVPNQAQRFDATVKIALHQIRAADIDLFVPAVQEVIRARVFEEPAHDGADGDRLTDALDTRPQTADAADDQVDAHAPLGCAPLG